MPEAVVCFPEGLRFHAGVFHVTKGRSIFQAEGTAYAQVWSPGRAFLVQGIVRGPMCERAAGLTG